MKSLLALYFGTILLAYLSQKYHPVRETLHMRGSRHFFFARTDVFVVIIIFWLSALSFLRTGYNDTGNYIAAFQDSPSVAEFFLPGTIWIGQATHFPICTAILCGSLRIIIISIFYSRPCSAALRL